MVLNWLTIKTLRGSILVASFLSMGWKMLQVRGEESLRGNGEEELHELGQTAKVTVYIIEGWERVNGPSSTNSSGETQRETARDKRGNG